MIERYFISKHNKVLKESLNQIYLFNRMFIAEPIGNN